ncbi:hypothetical protein ACHAXR_002464 [Thalassiosira sp. AJA248-18]
MARQAYRRHLNGAPRRAAKRQRNINSRWMHLGALAIGTRQLLQRCWARHSMATTTSVFLSAYAIVLRQVVNQQPVSQAIQTYINYVAGQIAIFGQHVQQWQNADRLLYDIPLVEWLSSREFRPRQHLRIDGIANDMTAIKMTCFNTEQLRRLYHHFGLREFLFAHNETDILVGTGHWRNGAENCYRFDPEELFLFTLTKCKTGNTNEQIIDMFFGGDYARWSYGYRWLLYYLDLRYRNIIGHQGLLRFLPQFMQFRDAIERYCQKDRLYYDHDGNSTLVPGLACLPYNIFGFIDDSVDPIQVPFSGPDGDYEGAPRREQYIDAQESVYSGYKHLHGIKVETVYLANGISTIFGPVSCSQNDRGTLNLSNLDNFLALIQAHLPPHERCMLFGDSIFRGLLQFITTYYRAIHPNVLTVPELTCNAAFRAARMPIERNYGQTSCVLRICDTKRGYQLGKRCPYALEQLRVCHLIMNCYICLNGDQGSSVNTFACSPPRLQDYLRL